MAYVLLATSCLQTLEKLLQGPLTRIPSLPKSGHYCECEVKVHTISEDNCKREWSHHSGIDGFWSFPISNVECVSVQPCLHTRQFQEQKALKN